MALTGTATLVAAIIAAIVSPVACLWLWSRLRGPRAVRFGSRMALFAACQISTTALVGVLVNDYGQFYSTWGDLLGVTSTTPVMNSAAHFGAAVPAPTTSTQKVALSQIAGTPDIPAAAGDWKTLSWSKRAEWTDRGAIVNTTVASAGSALSEQALVYLPPAYFRTGAAARLLPLVEVLTGYPGVPMNLVTRMHYPDRLLQAIKSGQAQNMILVMLRPAPTFPWDTECSDVPGGPQALHFFTDAVPDSVSRQFGVRPTGYAAVGDSTGGYCAAKIAMTDPSRFLAAVSLSGYYKAATDSTTRGIFNNKPAFRDQNDLEWRLQHLPAPDISLLIATARDEGGDDGYQVALRWLQDVKAPMAADELALDHGGHNFRTWGREIPYAMHWLSERFAAGKRS
ncbi:MAG TPA: alpha/beta hydrolase-fold protein [Sporichthyaceae bacterium]